MNKQMPVYVTRKNADGWIGTVWLNAYAVVGAATLVLANLVGWSIFGLVALVEQVI